MKIITFSIITFIFFSLLQVVRGLGSASTFAAIYGTSTLCGILAGQSTQNIQCYQNNQIISVQPNFSFQSISGGQWFFCGLRSNGLSLHCWDTTSSDSNLNFQPKRIYHSKTVRLADVSVGDVQVCAREIDTDKVRCWRGGYEKGFLFSSPEQALKFQSITSGIGFSCGILKDGGRVFCWGQNIVGTEIQSGFENIQMSSLVAGDSHACGLTMFGILICNGKNDSGQLEVPSSSAFEFSGLALGADFTCAIRRRNGLLLCWGGRFRFQSYYTEAIKNVSFELITSSLDFVCGLTTSNLSMICWGPGWSNRKNYVPLGMIIPGPCVKSSCSSCGTYPDSEILCHDNKNNICKSCRIENPLAVPLLPSVIPTQDSSKSKNNLFLVFLIVGSVGGFIGLCSIVFCLWTKIFDSWSKKTDSFEGPSIPEPAMDVASVSLSTRRQSFGTIRSRRSGSSSKYADKAETFVLPELAIATNNFSLKNKIGSGSFGIVYKGKLLDGREVAIKREVYTNKRKKFQENESAFDSEISLLTRLHHKHLVALVGFCEEENERLLVYEYMSNGALYDHLHNKQNIEKSSSILNCWKMRIRIALDAARGIDYLHNYAVPPIIHRDIKSSNILLDSNWTARVSDFGLSLIGSESNKEQVMTMKAVGTVGYIDPEYYVLSVLTTKSDVYGLGVVFLELLTGKRAVFKSEEQDMDPISLVEYAEPFLSQGKLNSILDKRVGKPEANELEAIELLGYTAIHCVNLEGKERPNISEIVANLEKALALCEESFLVSYSSTTLSFPTE